MAQAGHLALSNFIKSVHQNLREESKKIGFENAWRKHCSDTRNLEKYARAMQELACEYWTFCIEYTTNSRVEWTITTCLNYFSSDISKFRDKEKDIAEKLNYEFTVPTPDDPFRLKLLDVGSCYNPFYKFALFDVTAIDIAPVYEERVILCDFLRLKIGEASVLKYNQLCELPKNDFNIVVFSLLLDYLPSPSQRLLCCQKAYDLLRNEGLLIVITPDSNHVGANAKYMKSWRYVLAKMGFMRIVYKKLQHVHCMAFRKAVSKDVANRWAELHKDEQLFEEIYIPQDFNKSIEQVESKNKSEECYDVEIDLNELPQLENL